MNKESEEKPENVEDFDEAMRRVLVIPPDRAREIVRRTGPAAPADERRSTARKKGKPRRKPRQN